MLNLHLLQIKLTVAEYQAIIDAKPLRNIKSYLSRLPAYLIARCPFCSVEYVQHMDTYSPRYWDRLATSEADAVFHGYGVVNRCRHFALVESVAHSTTRPPLPFSSELKVAGNLVDKGLCKVVMHALPVCQIEQQAFVPRYTLFMFSYFSEYVPAEEVRRRARTYKIQNDWIGDEPVLPPIQPLPCTEDWWKELGLFVKTGQLYWVDTTDAALPIRTHDVNAFPYGDVPGAWEDKNI